MQKELAYRENDGVAVALFWHTQTDALTVSVVDRRTEDAFELSVDARDALEVFDHPYAYAAFRGLDTVAAGPREPVYA
jgi:hypothetical protein